MQKIVCSSIVALLLCISGCAHRRMGDLVFPEGVVQRAVLASDIQWQPGPAHLPSGCEMAVLEGEPRSTGLLTVRFKVHKGFVMPPHTHPRDERVTVLHGKVSVAFGINGSHDAAERFGPGDYYVNARDAIHMVWADEDSVIQITGMGPWETHFVKDPGVDGVR